ncbi:MAG: DNA-binding response OmpR family regulator [Arenicella sp.]|jgi:DNA-binding response OmpR family regulator
MKLLLIEDDKTLASALSRALSNEGFVVESSLTGQGGLDALSNFGADIVILDLGLPDIDGTSVLRKLRLSHKSLPTLILTARHATQDKVDALDLGADDYMQKPFEMAELLARIRVLARRLGTSTTNMIKHQNVSLDVAAQTISVEGKSLILTRREFMILKTLMENLGRIQTKDQIESKLYGWGEVIGSNTIEVHVSNLRKKLPANFIRTVRGLGYTVSKALNDESR